MLFIYPICWLGFWPNWFDIPAFGTKGLLAVLVCYGFGPSKLRFPRAEYLSLAGVGFALYIWYKFWMLIVWFGCWELPFYWTLEPSNAPKPSSLFTGADVEGASKSSKFISSLGGAGGCGLALAATTGFPRPVFACFWMTGASSWSLL